MLLGKELPWNFATLLIHVVVLSSGDAAGTRQSIYEVFEVPAVFFRPKNLVHNFERKGYSNIQVDVFIDAETADSRLADLVAEDCSQNGTLVVRSSSEVGSHARRGRNAYAGSKLENLILVYGSGSRIDLDLLRRAFGNRWNPRARVIAYVEEVDNETATEILGYFWKHDLLNVALTVQSQARFGLAENFIYNPFVPGEISGARGRLEKLNSSDFMFPDKLLDLHNHSIPISVFAYYPKVSLTNWTFLNGGADVEVLWALSKKLNFSIDMKTAPFFGLSYTTRLPSGKVVGMIGDLLNNRSDMIWTAQRMEAAIGYHVEFTYPMLQTGYCVLVPKAKMMPMIARMALPFPEVIWIAIAVSVAVLLVCFTLIGGKNKFITIAELLLHHRFGNIPKCNFNRILAISCILWAYLMACIYQANFINELILPKYYKDLDTLEELYDSNLPLLVAPDMMKVVKNSEVPTFKKLANRTVVHLVFKNCVDQLLKAFNVSCGVDEYISVLLAKIYKRNNNDTLATHSIKECLSLHWDVYVAKQGFPFLEKFNQLIRGLLESGLYLKWIVDRVQQSDVEERKPEKLTIKHCEGVFGVLFVGLGISSIAFILEQAKFHFWYKIANVFRRMKVKTR